MMTMTANGHPRNGSLVTVSGPMPMVAPFTGPSSQWPADAPAPHDDAPAALPAPSPGRRPAPRPGPRHEAPPATRERLRWPSLRLPDGDTVITWAMAATVALVAVDAAIVSYSHIYGLATGQWGSGAETGVQARLLPLSIDGVILEASLVKLYAARHRAVGKTRLATFMLWLGIAATIGANVTHGLPSSLVSHVVHIVIMALLSAWPAGALIGSVEMAMGLVRSMRDVAADDARADSPDCAPGDTDSDSDNDNETAPDQHGDTPDDATKNDRKQTPRPRPKAAADPVVAAIRKTRNWRTAPVDVSAIAARCGVSERTVERRLTALRNAA